MNLARPQNDDETGLPVADTNGPDNAVSGEAGGLDEERPVSGIHQQSTPVKAARPARRIIVIPSTKSESEPLSSNPARPDLREKARNMLSSVQNEVRDIDEFQADLDADTINQEGDEIRVAPDVAVNDEAKPMPAERSFRDKWMNIAAVFGAILIFGGGLMLRDRVVSVIPGISSLYKLAGIDVNSRGLEFTSVKTKTEANKDGAILVIEGSITNISGEAVAVPAVKLVMRSKNQQEIYAWFYEPEQKRLQSGKSIKFTTRLFDPPSDVHDVHLKFTDRRKQQAKLN